MPDEAVQAGDRLPWMSMSFTNSADALPTKGIYTFLRETGFHLFPFAPQADAIANAQVWCAAEFNAPAGNAWLKDHMHRLRMGY